MRGTLDPKDAAFALSTREGLPTDQYFLLAFDNAPPFEAVLADLAARADGIAALNKRLVPCPAHVDYPAWVRSPVPAGSFCRAVEADIRSWASCLAALAEICSHPLDASNTPWMVHVATPVADVPGADTDATVVLVRFSHALTDGGGGAALVRALFGRHVDVHDTMVAAVAAPAETSRTRMFASAVAGTALRTARVIPSLAGALIRARHTTPAPRTGEPLVFNSVSGCRRALAVLPVPTGPDTAGRRPHSLTDIASLTRTELALTAISVAMERYARDQGEDPRSLTAHVTVAVGADVPWHGENAFLPAIVPLSPMSDLRERALTIRASLRAERNRLADVRTVRQYRVAESIPLPLLRLAGALVGSGGNPGVHTSFTSLRCGDGELAVGDAPLALIAGFPTLSERVAIGHGLYGAGELLSLSVLASPDAVDLTRYEHYLREALETVYQLRRTRGGSVRFA